MHRLLGLAMLASCQAVFPLDDPRPDAPPDTPACAVGHDEDGDGIDDGCDHCPGIADADDLDGDGDGVGDACDPHPAEDCDQRLLFDNFTATTTAISTPSWQSDGEDLFQVMPVAEREIVFYPTGFDNVRVRAAIAIADDAIVDSSAAAVAEIASGVELSNTVFTRRGIGCRLTAAVPIDPQSVDVKLIDLTSGLQKTASGFNGDGTNNVGELVFDLDNSTRAGPSCSIRGANGFGETASPTPSLMTDGVVVVRSLGIALRLRWLEILTSTCPAT